MADKYYRVKKENFLWKAGAILKNHKYTNSRGYAPIEDVWNRVGGDDYITDIYVEAPENTEYFERVYPDTISGKLFRTKDQVVEAYEKAFKS